MTLTLAERLSLGGFGFFGIFDLSGSAGDGEAGSAAGEGACASGDAALAGFGRDGVSCFGVIFECVSDTDSSRGAIFRMTLALCTMASPE
jgi:hypothetical protein